MSLKYTIIVLFLTVLNAFNSMAQESFTRNLDDFISLEVIGNIRVEIYPSTDLHADLILENITPDKVISDITHLNLSIRLKTDSPENARVTVKLYYKTLNQITVSANAHIISDVPLKAEDVEFTAKLGGRIDLEVEMESLTASAIQGGIIYFSGNVQKQIVNVATGGIYSAYELEASDSYVKAASGGKAKVVAGRTIDATANFKGFIGYKGNPSSTYIKTNFGGEIASFKDEPAE